MNSRFTGIGSLLLGLAFFINNCSSHPSVPIQPQANPTNTVTAALSSTSTATSTATNSPTKTGTPTPTFTLPNTGTFTSSPTSTFTPTSTNSPTDTGTFTNTGTPTATPTWSNTGTVTSTVTNTLSPTATMSPTATSSPTVTNTTNTTPSATPTVTSTATITTTPSNDIIFCMYTLAAEAQNLYIINQDGSNLRNETNLNMEVTVVPRYGQWSPDKTKILFINVSDFNENEIYTMNANGTSRTDMGVAGLGARWSPDGTKIAFYATTGLSTVSVMPASGGAAISLCLNQDFSWSSDSTKLLLPGTSITTLLANGTSAAPTTIYNGPGGLFTSVAYSPDGTKIAASYEDGGPSSLWEMNSDGSGAVSLTTIGGGGPDWSPDGTKWLFFSGTGSNVLYVMSPTGTGLVQLSPTGDSCTSAAWSPDSQHVVFYDSTANGLYTVAVNGTGLTDIYNPATGTTALDPDWVSGY